MLVFDQLKKDDSQLRFLAVVVVGGLGVLFTGLWWVQVVSSQYYQDKLENQSIRTVRLPAERGNILDRDGRPLAESRPSYNLNLYLEDLSPKFQATFSAAAGRVRTNLANLKAAEKKKLAPQTPWWSAWWSERKLDKKLNQQFPFTTGMRETIAQQTRFAVSSNIVADLAARLLQPIVFDPKTFQKSYAQARALPMPILANLSPPEVARFEEQSMHTPGMDLDIQSLRYYPHDTLAFHVLGYLSSNPDSIEGEQSDYSYRLEDYSGVVGIEWLCDKYLRGSAGSKSVLVDNLGYRRSETVVSPAEPGNNVVLTIDLDIQKAAELALQTQQANIRGAVVVMNATNGDILAMASAPTFNPNYKVRHPEPAIWAAENARFNDNELKVQLNRAMQENYHPGSIFKIIVGLAALEKGVLDPKAFFHSDGSYTMPGKREPIGDTAGAGEFDLNRAIAKSSNPYFITQGLKPGVLQKIIEISQHLHLGERTGLMPRQEAPGNLPDLKRIASNWRDGDTANFSIGQGELDVTPLQIALLGVAVANHGKVFYPRLVARVESFDGGQVFQSFPEGRLRDNLNVSERNLMIMHEAMLQDVMSDEGSGRDVRIPGFQVAGKTGTAEVMKNGQKDKAFKDTWFLSFGPYENPRYVVLAMVEGGLSGARTCVPIARKIYDALLQRELERLRKPGQNKDTVAQTR